MASLWQKHWVLERNSILLLVGILIVIAFGGLVEVVPLFYLRSTIENAEGMRPYTPLELAGRNIYVSSMWVSGILQGLMWRAYTSLGFLEYSFIETVEAMHPFYVIRALGGALFLAGTLIMAFNIWRTIYPAREMTEAMPGLAPAE